MAEGVISKIEIVDLFGQYSYQIPKAGKMPKAAIIYGENGVGKSTLLRLTFHMLSSANNRGHRAALTKVPYRYFSVELSSGLKLSAKRSEDDLSSQLIHLSLERKDKKTAEWNYNANKSNPHMRFVERDGVLIPIDEDNEFVLLDRKSRHSVAGRDTLRGEEPYMAALKESAPTLFFVSADRRLDSDSVSDPSDEMELRRLIRLDEPKRINELVNRSREVALAQAMVSAARWIQRRTVVSANQGSTNVHSVYLNVVRHLAGSAPRTADGHVDNIDIETFAQRLDDVETRTAALAKYELSAPLNLREFKKAIAKGSLSKRNLAASVLKPYIESLEGRLHALNPLYEIVDRFTSVINRFLSRKSIIYKATQGFTIVNDVGVKLEPSQLSSGEQQLILLFSYVLIARDNPSVFMIDEPEISLNVKWQRQLLQSLVEITEGADIQFVLASHSLELISQHRDRVIRLESSKHGIST